MDTGEQIGNTEVEYVVYDESSSGGSIESDGGNELMLEDEDTENDDDLIIKQEHVCGKCNKTYKSFGSLKRHWAKFCGGTTESKPKKRKPTIDQNVFKQTKPKIDNRKLPIESGKCYCCFEAFNSAHNGHIACQFCPKAFKSDDSLNRHLYCLHSASNMFPCETCNATCPNKEILNLHLESHKKGKPFACNVCGKDFTRKYHLDRHRNATTCGGDTSRTGSTCNVCGKVFTRIDNLREHLRSHVGQSTRRRDYPCPYCDMAFFGSSLLNIHIRTHTKERPFKCDLCEKSFPSNGALRKHRRMHTGEKPYKCNVCDKRFAAKETLNRHMKVHTGEKPHICIYCQKGFIQATQLQAHLFHHTGENGFTCDFCSRDFSRRTRLTTHVQKIHADVMPECKECNEKFITNKDYEVHMSTHNTEENSEEYVYLKGKIACLLTTYLEEEQLKAYGWPEIDVEEVLEKLIKDCGSAPSSLTEGDKITKLRDNVKLLLIFVIGTEVIKSMLNNYSVDEVIEKLTDPKVEN